MIGITFISHYGLGLSAVIGFILDIMVLYAICTKGGFVGYDEDK